MVEGGKQRCPLSVVCGAIVGPLHMLYLMIEDSRHGRYRPRAVCVAYVLGVRDDEGGTTRASLSCVYVRLLDMVITTVNKTHTLVLGLGCAGELKVVNKSATSMCVCTACGQDVLDDRMRTPYACLAARQGQTEGLQLLLARGVPLDGHVSAMAAGWVGSLSCLRLAHEAGDKLAAASGEPLVFDTGRMMLGLLF
jgi:hypothetical protein